jgi:CelD/BcsL family acetyltransferase involved in cellulose biosynthesis
MSALIPVGKSDNFGVMPPLSPVVETLSFEHFCRAEEAWNALALSVASPVPFMSHPWIRLWWKHFGEGQEFLAVVVRDADTLLGAVPLAVRPAGPGLELAEIVGTGPVPTRGMGLADKADFLVRAGHPEAGKLLVAEVTRLLDRVDLLDVKGLDALSDTRAGLETAGAALRFRRSVSPYLTLSTSWDEYSRTRSRNFRKHLKKYWRLLEQAGTLEVSRMQPGDDVAGWMGDVFAVNDLSWKAERGTNLFRSPEIRDFFATLVPEMAAQGWIDLHAIRLDGKLAVYELCFDYGGKLFSYNGAYRAELGQGSPGTALTAAVIESACGRGRSEYDMLRGAESYKRRWSETSRTELQLLLPANRAAARIKTSLGPALKARLKQWSWLTEQADRLSGLLSRRRYR